MTDPRTLSLDTAIALLDAQSKHWRLQAENRADSPRRYSCYAWAGGRRFGVNRATPLDAVRAALERIASNRLRLTR